MNEGSDMREEDPTGHWSLVTGHSFDRAAGAVVQSAHEEGMRGIMEEQK